MKWFGFKKRKHSPTRITNARSERSGHKSSASRSTAATLRGDGSSGHHSSSGRRRRRHSHSTSLPRDIYTRSYYAPPQGNFYPPNVVRPPQKVLNPYPGYFRNMSPADYEDNLVDEKGYAQQLYRNQFLFFRPKKQTNTAPYSMDNGFVVGYGDRLGNRPQQPVNTWDNVQRHSAPDFPKKLISANSKQNAAWNWGFHEQHKPQYDYRPISVTTIRRVSKVNNWFKSIDETRSEIIKPVQGK